MNFANLKEWTTPRGKVTELAIDGKIAWKSVVPLGALSTLAVGSSVFMNVNGVRTEFLVVHQGLPDATLYDSSCDGTWLLMKYIYEKRSWNESSDFTNYDDDGIHSYLNGTFLNLFDSSIRSLIKQVKIPSADWAQNMRNVSAKIFLLSASEVGRYAWGEEDNFSYNMTEGKVLSYFENAPDSKLLAYMNGTVTYWWLRSLYYSSPDSIGYNSPCCISQYGHVDWYAAEDHYGVRPALILPSDALVDTNFNVIA